MAERFPWLSERSLRELLFQLARKPRYSQEVKTYALKDVEALAKRAAALPTAPPAAKTPRGEDARSTNVDRKADGDSSLKAEAAAPREEGHSAATSRRRVPDLPRGHGLHHDVSRMRASFSRGVPQGDDRVVMGRGQCLQANAPRDQLSCPMCRATRVRDSTAFRVGETVDARWGGRFDAGTVDEAILDEAGEVQAYDVNWTDGSSNRIRASLVRAAVPGTPLG